MALDMALVALTHDRGLRVIRGGGPQWAVNGATLRRVAIAAGGRSPTHLNSRKPEESPRCNARYVILCMTGI